MRRIILFSAAAAIILMAVYVVLFHASRREATFFPMGGIPFKVVAYDRTAFQFYKDMAAVKKSVAELELVFNRFNPESELARINREAAVRPFAMNPNMARIMAFSRKWQKESSGAFDPTVAPLVELWQGAGKTKQVPSEKMISAALSRVGLDKVSQAGVERIFFTHEGMSLDFGAIAKGFINDEIAELLKMRGVRRGVVDAAGNAIAFGDGQFQFGIQDPFAERGRLLGTVNVKASAVITSGNYERFVEINGKKYSHIIDPRTGRPVDNGLVSATVIGSSGADADALATALIVLGREKGIELLKRLEKFEAILVEGSAPDFEIWISASLVHKLQLNLGQVERIHEF